MATKSVLSINPYTPVFNFPFWIWFLLGTEGRHKFPGASVTPTAPTLSETIHMTTNMGQNPPRGLPILLTRQCSLLVKPGFYRSSVWFKGLDLIDRVPDELWTEVRDIVEETGIKTIPKKKKCKKAKWLSGEALQIAVKRREAKSKAEKERYKHLNAEFQRIARREKKASSAINAKK